MIQHSRPDPKYLPNISNGPRRGFGLRGWVQVALFATGGLALTALTGLVASLVRLYWGITTAVVFSILISSFLPAVINFRLATKRLRHRTGWTLLGLLGSYLSTMILLSLGPKQTAAPVTTAADVEPLVDADTEGAHCMNQPVQCPQCKSEKVIAESNASAWVTWGLPILGAVILGWVIAPQVESGTPRGLVHLLAGTTVILGPVVVRMLTRGYRCDDCSHRWS